MMRGVSRSTLAWLGLALAGLVVAVAVSFAASQLAKPKIGLTSEPISRVTELAPHKPHRRAPRPTTTTTQPPTAPQGTGAPATSGNGEGDEGDDD